ncbi:MAG: hypothetical protein GC145_06290 [Caulobacter sp.]|nr:hypothetical protein [Caulobacter sp.]
MSALLKLLAGSAGPYIAGGVAVIIAALLAFGGLQTARLNHAKADQINPATGAKWKVEAKRDAKLLASAVRDLGQCRENEATQAAAITRQNGEIDAWKAEGDRLAAEARAAAQRAASVRRTAEKAAADIMAARAGPDACQSAQALIEESLK